MSNEVCISSFYCGWMVKGQLYDQLALVLHCLPLFFSPCFECEWPLIQNMRACFKSPSNPSYVAFCLCLVWWSAKILLYLWRVNTCSSTNIFTRKHLEHEHFTLKTLSWTWDLFDLGTSEIGVGGHDGEVPCIRIGSEIAPVWWVHKKCCLQAGFGRSRWKVGLDGISFLRKMPFWVPINTYLIIPVTSASLSPTLEIRYSVPTFQTADNIPLNRFICSHLPYVSHFSNCTLFWRGGQGDHMS